MLVVVVSMLSTAPQPIRNIVFQSAVPKVTGQTREAFLPQGRVTLDLVGSQLPEHSISFTGELGKGWGAREIPETLGKELLPPQGLPDQLPTSRPQVMKVRLQPPSGTELPAFNPIVHPSAITQVLLLANPQKVRAQLRQGSTPGWH